MESADRVSTSPGAADNGAEHILTLADVLRVCAPLLADVEADRFHSAATILIEGKRGPLQSLCAKNKGWDVSLRGSGLSSATMRSIAEVRRDLESKVISGARELIARKDGLGVSAYLPAPIDAEAVFGTPTIPLATASY